jgi:RpiR family carbohydrate utilization transcriptional regulator
MNDFFVRLQTKYPVLRKSEKKIADYLQQHSHQRMDLTITEFANALNLSEATISRFCRVLGYQGFHDFKFSLTACQSTVEGFQNIPVDILETDSTPEIAKKLCDDLSRALVETQRSLNMDQVIAAVEAMIQAKRVILYAIGAGSCGIAHAAHHLFVKAGINCVVYTEEYMQIVTASMLDKDSVAFGISSTGMSKHVVDALKVASGKGAITIGLTSNRDADLAKVSKICLIIAAGNRNIPLYGDFMEAKVCQLYVMELLYLNILFKLGEVSKKTLKESTEALKTYYL